MATRRCNCQTQRKMACQRLYDSRPVADRGFTLVELLIGLALTAILLTAVAVAFSASVTSYQENEEMFWAMNNARQALARITSQLRSGYWVNPVAASNQCSFFTSAGEDITYEFRDASHTSPACRNKLYLIMNATSQEYVLCDNVVAATFTKTATDDGTDCKSVQISLTVRSGDCERVLSAAAAVRRNL